MNATLYRNIVILVYVLLLPLVGFAQRAGDLDRSFNYGRGENYQFNDGYGVTGLILISALQNNGKIIIGGQFNSFNQISRKQIARLNADGSLDTTFNPGTGANGGVYSIAIQDDGKIIIGGYFTTFNGNTINRIARLNANGSLDATFNPSNGANGGVRTIAVQGDGKIIIGGEFTSYNSITRNKIARLNTDGSLDTTFNSGTGADNTVLTIALQNNGKINIGGEFTFFNGTFRNRIARLNADGSLDNTFNPGDGANGPVYTTAMQADGKIIIGGEFTAFNSTTRNFIARLNADGSLDATFNTGTGANDRVRTIAMQPNGKIIIGGHFTSFNGTTRIRIARLNLNGSLDATFNPSTGANDAIMTTSLQANGKLIICGFFSSYNGTTGNHIACLNTDGSLDATFNPGTGANGSVQTIVLQSNGKIILGGDFSSFNGTSRSGIARLNADGSLDATFNPGTEANVSINTIAIQPDGKMIIGGSFWNYRGTARNCIARLNADGSLDATFNPGTGANWTVKTVALQSDGKIIIGGDFTTFNGIARNRLARLNSNGSLDDNFNIGTGANYLIQSIVLNPDGRIIVGGRFTSFNGISINSLICLNSDGSLDATFNSRVNGSVESIYLQTNGSLIIGGFFDYVNNTPRSCIARLNADGSLDNIFNPVFGANGGVLSIAVQADGKVIIGGGFSFFNGIARNNIARLNANGSLDATFNPGTGANGSILSTALQADNKIILGGFFNGYNNLSTPNVVRIQGFSICTTPDTPTISGNNLFCESNTTILTSSTLTGNLWSTGDTSRTITVSSTGSYSVRAIVGVCTSDVSDTFRVSLNQVETPTITGNNFFCSNRITRLISSSPVGNLWSTGDTTRSISVFSPGSYSVRVNSGGCTSSVSSNFEVSLRNNSQSNLNQSICQGNSYQFGGSPRTTAGVYIDTLTNAVGCDSIVTLNLTVRPVSSLLLSQSICQGNSYLFNGLPITVSGTYYDTLANSVGCDSIVTLNLTVRAVSSTSIIQSICQGNSYQFAGISRTNTGFYYDTLTNTFGCDSVVSLNLTVINPSTPPISGDTSLCAGNTTRLTSSSLTGNLWSTGDTTQFINVAQAGSYTVRVINGGCTSAASAPFRVVNAGPSPTVINFDTTSNRCLGARLQLTPAGTFAHYQWNTGERTRSIYTRTSGQYSVQVANSDSCFGLPSSPIFIAFDTNWCSVEIFRVGLDSITANVWADYYIWYLDGIELLTSNTLKTIPIQGDGVYTFRAVSAGRTSPLSNPIVITSARKSTVTKFEVYPNPATNKVTVNTSGTGTLEILNTLGQVVITQPAAATNELNISHLAKGVFTVRFNGASKMLVVK